MRGRLVVITEGLSHLRAKVLSVPFHSTNIFSHHFSSLQQLSVIQACNISCIPGVSRNYKRPCTHLSDMPEEYMRNLFHFS